MLCDAQPDRSVDSMRSSIARLQQSLAEGGHVEVARARRLAELWKLTLPDGREEAAGRKVDAALKRFMHASGRARPEDLDSTMRSDLLASISGALSGVADSAVPTGLVASTKREALDVLSTREAWLYRDWQSAIGHHMLEVPEGSPRRFDVKGYRAFTDLASQGSASDRAWLERISELTVDLDVSRDETVDARVAQLKGVYLALAGLIAEFHDAEPAQSSVGETTLGAVTATLAAETAGSD